MQNKITSFSTLDFQIKEVEKILRKNSFLLNVMHYLNRIKLPDWYVGGGSITQIIWNYYHKFGPNYGIKDYDIVYFDKDNISETKQNLWQEKIRKHFPNFPVQLEVVNEARTHIWYEEYFGKKINPYSCVEEAIYGFPTTATAIGVKLIYDNKIQIFAPHGLSDIFSLKVRANKVEITKKVFEDKCKKWLKTWPKLTIIPWNYK